jgi:D-xylose 1-dehydrogenase
MVVRDSRPDGQFVETGTAMTSQYISEEKRAIYPSLSGKRVLVTGGGSGIGAGIVEAFVRQNASVTFFDIAEEESLALVAQLNGKPRFELVDLTNIAATQARILKRGPFDILINNAANDDRHEIADVSEDYWDNRMAVNLKHLFFCAQVAAPMMKARGGGVIINLGSISWHLALPALPLYETAKAGIEGLTRSLARDLGADGIRVTCVIPGSVRTVRQLKWYDADAEAEIIKNQCLKAKLIPEDVAALILFLASDDARLVTAHSYYVDAGWR